MSCLSDGLDLEKNEGVEESSRVKEERRSSDNGRADEQSKDAL